MRLYGFGSLAKFLALLAILMYSADNITVMGDLNLTNAVNQLDDELHETGIVQIVSIK